jgi:cytoskeletal protein CcmA (bactofilin family)
METSKSEEAVQAHLGKGSRVEGKLTFEGSVKIDGHVEGEIQAQQAVIVGESAVINAQISADTIVVKGKVTGDITARKQVELRSPAKLTGNITTPSLVIHEGVVFEGHCSMGGAENKLEKSDRKVALFPKEERSSTSSVRMPSEAVK